MRPKIRSKMRSKRDHTQMGNGTFLGRNLPFQLGWERVEQGPRVSRLGRKEHTIPDINH